MKSVKSKIYSFGIIAAIYISAFLVIYCIFPFLRFSHTLVNLFIADVIATVVIFIFSMIFSNSSVYDPYWSIVPPIIAIYLIILFPDANRAQAAGCYIPCAVLGHPPDPELVPGVAGIEAPGLAVYVHCGESRKIILACKFPRYPFYAHRICIPGLPAALVFPVVFGTFQCI